MYGYGAAAGVAGIMGRLMLALFICAIAAYVFALSIIYNAAQRYGHGDLAAKLVFIGIFLTPVVAALCLIVVLLKDKNGGRRPMP